MAYQVRSPLKGELIRIEEVPDEAFSEKMIGDGVAIKTKESKIFSPVEGEVTMVYETGHAIGITAEDGSEFMIHIGVDTVKLKGKPFKTRVKMGEKVSFDTVISLVNWGCIRRSRYDDSLIIICLNKKIQVLHPEGGVNRKDILFETID